MAPLTQHDNCVFVLLLAVTNDHRKKGGYDGVNGTVFVNRNVPNFRGTEVMDAAIVWEGTKAAVILICFETAFNETLELKLF